MDLHVVFVLLVILFLFRLPKDRTTERLLIDMETEYRPASRVSQMRYQSTL